MSRRRRPLVLLVLPALIAGCGDDQRSAAQRSAAQPADARARDAREIRRVATLAYAERDPRKCRSFTDRYLLSMFGPGSRAAAIERCQDHQTRTADGIPRTVAVRRLRVTADVADVAVRVDDDDVVLKLVRQPDGWRLDDTVSDGVSAAEAQARSRTAARQPDVEPNDVAEGARVAFRHIPGISAPARISVAVLGVDAPGSLADGRTTVTGARVGALGVPRAGQQAYRVVNVRIRLRNNGRRRFVGLVSGELTDGRRRTWPTVPAALARRPDWTSGTDGLRPGQALTRTLTFVLPVKSSVRTVTLMPSVKSRPQTVSAMEPLRATWRIGRR